MPMHDWTRVSPGSFHTFHTAWITEIARALNNGVLPDGFYAESEQVAGQTGPDVLTLDADPDWAVEGRTDALESAGAATTLVAPPNVSVKQVASEQEVYAEKRNRLVIRHSSGDDLVAYIEVVSSGNKSSRRALDRFLDKACTALEPSIVGVKRRNDHAQMLGRAAPDGGRFRRRHCDCWHGVSPFQVISREGGCDDAA